MKHAITLVELLMVRPRPSTERDHHLREQLMRHDLRVSKDLNAAGPHNWLASLHQAFVPGLHHAVKMRSPQGPG